MVDAIVSDASTMETSHTEVKLFQHDHYIVYYCCLMFIHACLIILTFGDCIHQHQELLMQRSMWHLQ